MESSEAAVPRRTPTPHLEQQAPPTQPRAFSRLIRPLVFTVGVGDAHLGALEAGRGHGINAMSVYRLLFRLGGDLAVRVRQVSSPELLR